MPGEDNPSLKSSRRSFLGSSAATLGAGWLMANWPQVKAAAHAAHEHAASGDAAAFKFLSADEAVDVEAVTAQIIPSGATPGAREAHVVHFIDLALADFFAAQADTIADGNGILGHIFGSKDVSRQVASQVASQTGIGEGVLKAMLPVVAAMMMGALSKRMSQPAAVGADTGLGGGLLGMLSPALDANRDGSMVDDVAGMVGRLLSGR